jgi:S-(hydroxymethyl)glutathione dehydrogenase/alcohol dehydrogenase
MPGDQLRPIRALVLADYDEVPQVESVMLRGPGPGEVRVAIRSSGVCHSDLHALSATLPLPVPMVLGHEASGVVLETGPGVTGVTAGSPVVVTWVPACGHCFWCVSGQPELCEEANRGAVQGTGREGTTHLSRGEEELYPFSWAGTLAEQVVVPEAAVVALPVDMPWDEAALLGCAVQTGVGAAFHAPVGPGSSVLVVGLGGVGLNIIQGARIMGATAIIGADPVRAKREAALALGATQVVDPGATDTLSAVLALTQDRGVDVAFEAVGSPDLLQMAFNAVRRGGTAVAVGVPAPHLELTLNAFSFPSQEKTLTGSWLGGSYPPRDVPRLARLWESGALRLAPLISAPYTLEDAPQALRDLAEGRVIRPVVHPDHGTNSEMTAS